MNGALSLEEAQARLLALAPEMSAYEEEIAPASAVRYLARDVKALGSQPSADLSAMDGYALGPGDGPWRRIGESRAGCPFAGTLGVGECVRISTGAHIPAGGERILLQEDARTQGDMIMASECPPQGRHVRKAGFDFHKGDTILSRGAPRNAATLALAAAAGHAALPWRAPPSVAVLDSGDELVRVGQPCEPHQLPATNSIMLGAMLHPLVGPADRLGPVADDRDALARTLRRAQDNHILVTSGGASVGDHDLIQPALEAWGARIEFWKVAIKPGKPLMVATREVEWGRQVIIGLPGNPVSSFVTCFLFVLPLVRAAMGAAAPLSRTITLPAAEALPSGGPRREFLRAVHDGGAVRRTGSQDSSGLMALAQATCLIDRPARAKAVEMGDPVPVHLLANG